MPLQYALTQYRSDKEKLLALFDALVSLQLEIADSGKFELLKELCETIYEKRERVIVFTQFKEITEYLADYLTGMKKIIGTMENYTASRAKAC